MNTQQRTWILRLLIILLSLAIAFLLIQLKAIFIFITTLFTKLLLPVGLAALFSYLLHPFVEMIEGYGISRTIAVIITFTFLLICTGFIVMIGYPSIVK